MSRPEFEGFDGEQQRVVVDVRNGGGWKQTAGLLGAGAIIAGGGILAWQMWGEESTVEPVEDATVLDIEPINWDCRSIMTTEFGDSEVNHDSSIPGFWMRVNASGEVDTLTCVSGGAEIDDDDPNNVYIDVDTDNIELFSAMDENALEAEHHQGQGSHTGNIFGEVTGAFGWDGPTEVVDERFEDMETEARKNAVNHVQRECGPEAWELNQQAITYSYLDQVAQQHGITVEDGQDIQEALLAQDIHVTVNFVGGEPEFGNRYELSDEYDTEFAEAGECEVASDALDPQYEIHQEAPAEDDAPHGRNSDN